MEEVAGQQDSTPGTEKQEDMWRQWVMSKCETEGKSLKCSGKQPCPEKETKSRKESVFRGKN